MKWKILIIIIMGVLMINLVSADINLNPFAVNKIYEKEITTDMSDFIKSDFNSEYGIIKLSKTFFWIPTDKIAEYSLTKNTYYCMVNCSAEGKVTFYEQGSLFEGINFINIKDNNLEEIPYKFYIGNGYENLTRKVCSEPIIDEEKGEEINVICKNENYLEPKWEEYEKDILPIGNYEWKIEGQKNERDNIDWIVTSFGKELIEWADWVSLNWYENATINASLPDIGDFVTPFVFYKNGSWYIMSGKATGSFDGFVYNDTSHSWLQNKTINASLPDIGDYSALSIFYKDGFWYMISGRSAGSFPGFVYNDTSHSWLQNKTINASLRDMGSYTKPSIFYKDGFWYMIAGEADTDLLNGFVYNDTSHSWLQNKTINASLPSTDAFVTPFVFYKNGSWYIMSGKATGSFDGFVYNDTSHSWLQNKTINASLPDIGDYSAPSIFYKDGFWYMISGENAGFKGFNYYETTAVGDTCTYVANDWAITCSDNCVISSNVAGSGGTWSAIGNGRITLNANITNFNKYHISGGCNVTCINGCIKYS